MSRSNKGVSLISLVIIIIVTIILLGTAVTAGYRYIQLARKTRAQALSLTIGNAAYRRQNDVTTGVTQGYYAGYAFDIFKDPSKYPFIEGIPSGDLYSGDILSGDNLISNGIPDFLEKDGSQWYLIDSESAYDLGAPGADELLTNNLSYQLTYGDSAKEQKVRLVLADYATGEAYYVQIPIELLQSCISAGSGECPNSVNGRHKYTIVTCVDNSICIYCGQVGTPALDHDWQESTCTAPGSCKRCGIVNTGDPAKGHLFITNDDVASNSDVVKKVTARGDIALESVSGDAWIANSGKHWHECARCGVKFENEEHVIEGYINITDTHHQSGCDICGWLSVLAPHNYGDPEAISEIEHKRTCIACLHETTHHEKSTTNPHTDVAITWFADCESFHYRVCSQDVTCNKLTVITDSGVQTSAVFKEAHIDNNNDFYCDVCGRGTDRTPPEEFNNEDFNSYFKVKSTTTSTITLEAYTVDSGIGIAYYQFGKHNASTNKVEWDTNQIVPTNASEPVTYTFTGLDNNKEYLLYVRAFDKEGNVNTPATVVGKTNDFPEFAGLTDMPTKPVKGPINIGIKEIETELTDIYVQYKQGSGDWGNNIPIDSLNTTSITLNDEEETLVFRFKDSKGNISDKTWTYTTNFIDNTAPRVKITAKAGDTNTESLAQHFATVTISDDLGRPVRAGIAQETVVQYAWSTSKTVVPTNFETLKTENTATVASVSFDIGTPVGAVGEYYLWIKSGIRDAVGNVTTENTVSDEISFIVDDTEAVISNITMLDEDPDDQVPDEHLFVKTNGEVIVRFDVDKKLKQNPIVRINGVDMSITHSTDGLHYTCSIIIDNSFDEGILELLIGDVVSINGRLSERTYTNADIVEGQGPVFYDKTRPLLKYIAKNSGAGIGAGNGKLFLINFDPNTLDSVSGMPDTQGKIQDIDLIINSARPRREGYVFAGWSTTSGNNNAVQYTAGSSFMLDQTTTLYAVWKVPAYYVTGAEFNIALKKLTGKTDVNRETSDTSIKKIIFDTTTPIDSIPSNKVNVSTPAGEPIYAWYEEDTSNPGTGVVKLRTTGTATLLNPNSSYMFYGFKGITGEVNVCQMLGLSIDTIELTGMTAMFGLFGTTDLTSFALGEYFDTSSVTNMHMCFYQTGRYSMTRFDLGKKFDTSQVTNMAYMFDYTGNEKLIELDLGDKFNTSNVNDMAYMFYRTGEKQLIRFILGNKFNTTKVTNMKYMFYYTGRENLATLNLGDMFDTSGCHYMDYMFCGTAYNKLATLDLGDKFDTRRVGTMVGMFYSFGGPYMTNLNLGDKFNTSQVTDMSYMFYECGKDLVSINLGNNFSTYNVTNMSHMFYYTGANKLLSLDLGTKFDTRNVTDMSYMFYYCGIVKLEHLNLGDKFNTSKVINMDHMFFCCGRYSLTSIDLGSQFDTSSVEDMQYMFAYAFNKITEFSLGEDFDTKKVKNMQYMFRYFGYNNLTSLDLGNKFDTKNVTNMKHMFSECGQEKMSSLNLGDNFDTRLVEDFSYMFNGCGFHELRSINLGSSFHTTSAINMEGMFSKCELIKTIYVSESFDISNVTNSVDMFSGDRALRGGSGTEYSDTNSNDATFAHIDGGTSNPGYFTILP